MSCGTISIPLQSFTTAFNGPKPIENFDMITTGSIEDNEQITDDSSMNTKSKNSNDNNKHEIAHASTSETITAHTHPSSEVLSSHHEAQLESTASSLQQKKESCHFPNNLKMAEKMSAYHPMQPCHDKKLWTIQKPPSSTDISKMSP